MADNGKLSASELSPIPGGELRKDAAAAWNAPGGPADAGLRPTGSMSSYRTYDEQVYLYGVYERGGNLAARPGTSNHGWGIAIDLPESWMWDWMRDHGAKYGWRKTEAFSEPWHFNFVPGTYQAPPAFKPLKHGMRGPRVVKYTRRLAFIRKPGGKAYLPRQFWKYRDTVVRGVKSFQASHDLKADGVIGARTAAKINATFEHQWRRRGK